jgi:hypothetical protein
MEHIVTIDDIAYCGLNCRLCNLTTILPDSAGKLLEIMKADRWEMFGGIIYPEFDAFWKMLHALSVYRETCQLCQGGCGNPDCRIRICARERGLRLCAECADYPCQMLKDFYAGHYVKLAVYNERIREHGIDAFLAEQQELVDKGLSFRDLI